MSSLYISLHVPRPRPSSTFQAFQPSRSLKASSKTPSRPFNPRFNQLVYYPLSLSLSLKSNDPPHECIVLYFYRYLDSWYYTLSSETFEQQSRYLFLACHCFYISPPPLPPTTHWYLLRISSSFRPPLSCVSISKPPFSTQFFFFLVFIYVYNQILSCSYHQPLDCSYHIIHIIPTTQFFRFFFSFFLSSFCFFLHL